MNTETKHTPGPWWLRNVDSTLYVEGNARDPRVTQEVASVGPKESGREQQAADALLIAAAPELLAALTGLLEIVRLSRGVAGFHQNGNLAEWDEFEEIDDARAVIAKATREI